MRIEDMSVEELLELNQIICDRIDYLQSLETHEMLRRLHLGNQVHFADKMGRRVFGTVVKINRKTVVVQSEDGKQWKVSPGLLSLVTDIEEI